MTKVNFTVDAALLRELGSRLVGKPHIALAELIKNSYDADARHVRIVFGDDRITVEDDGHGMSADTFERYWMRVGTTHKAAEKVSPELGRSLTGSKGVGRLAAQLLASRLEIVSIALVDPTLVGYAKRSRARDNTVERQLTAVVDWEAAVRNGELTSVEIPIEEGGDSGPFANDSRVGTRLVLSGLRDEWSEETFRGLARELWALQPPFEVDADTDSAFDVSLVSADRVYVDEFRDQMQAIFRNWQGRITYQLKEDDGSAEVLFEFDPNRAFDTDEAPRPGGTEPGDCHDGQAVPPTNDGPATVDPGQSRLLVLQTELKNSFANQLTIRVLNCPVGEFDGEIRIFNLTHRQAQGLSVDVSRQWMATYGGAHIYDDRFRLPYYGPEDWLHVERDHARRLSRSQLVPEALSVKKAMQDLPSRRRIFGTINVSTAREQRTATARGLTDNQALAIQVTRDRLVDNVAYNALANMVRLGLDLYSTEVARSKATKRPRPKGPTPPPKPSSDLASVRDAIEAVRNRLPNAAYQSIIDYLADAETRVAELETSRENEAALLGALATVGMTTLAWEHESTKQRLVVQSAAGVLADASPRDGSELAQVIDQQAESLRQSAKRLDDISGMFRHLMDREARESKNAFRARRFISRTARQLQPLARGAKVSTDAIPDNLLLAPGTHAGWAAIVQNLLLNAFNAVLEHPSRCVDIDGGSGTSTSWIRIQDTGSGVDLAKAERYFEPFERGMSDDPRRAQMGLGGAGLGLTIVRMIADSMNVTVRFAEPDESHHTAVVIEWEKKS